MYSNHPLQIILRAQAGLPLVFGGWLSDARARQEYLGAPGVKQEDICELWWVSAPRSLCRQLL